MKRTDRKGKEKGKKEKKLKEGDKKGATETKWIKKPCSNKQMKQRTERTQ